MFEILDHFTTINILEYLDCESLRNLAKCSKYILENHKDYIYYRNAMENELVDSLDYFIKGLFGIPIFNNQPLNDLLYYVSNQDSLLIAGGFPTQLYMGQIPKPTSDIDIYILGGVRHTYTSKDTEFIKENLVDVYNLLEFIYTNYSDIRVQRMGSNVYNIKVREFTHPIQIILTIHSSPAEVLSSFDNSHNRCGIYEKNTYVGMDAMLSHSTQTTYFYTPSKASRYIKAIDLGFDVFGLNEREIEGLLELVPVLNETNSDNFVRSTPKHILKGLQINARPIKNWKIGYSEQTATIKMFDKLVIDISKPLSSSVKLAIYNGKGFRDYPKLRTAIRPSVILKSPNSAFLKIKKPRLQTYKYQVTGKLIYTIRGCYIEVLDLAEVEKLKVVKSNMLEIFLNYHKIKELPHRISNCRTLTTWAEFQTYREEVGQPINTELMMSSLQLGFEYDDCMRMYSNRVFIKGILDFPQGLTEELYLFEIETIPLLKEYSFDEYTDFIKPPFSWGFFENKIISSTRLFY
jgi:hypothetical protein